MSKIKISEMADATVTEDDLVVVVSDGITKKTPVGNLLITKHPAYPRWRDLSKEIISAKIAGIADPDLVKIADDGAESAGVFVYSFDATKEEEVFLHIEMPHEWSKGTEITPHFHWAPSNSNSGNVKWGLEYTIAAPEEPFGNSVIIYKEEACSGVSNQHQHATFDAIDTSAYDYFNGATIMLLIRAFRTLADTNNYASDAFLLFVDFHYQFSSQGSEEI